MHRIRSTAVVAGVVTLLYLPTHVSLAGAVTAKPATPATPAAPSAPSAAWGPEVKLPDGSTARFGKDLAEPRVKIDPGPGRPITLHEDVSRMMHEGWTYTLADGPRLKVRDEASGTVWYFGFGGKLIDKVEAGTERV